MHVLPKRFDRIRHDGRFANGARAENITRARELLKMAAADRESASTNTDDRSITSLPVLRRAHDHRRDVRARNPTSREIGGTGLYDRVDSS